MSRRREGGFTFVEVMLALAIGLIVVVGMYEAFMNLHRFWTAASVTSDQRQKARAALETVTRDLQMAGYQTTNYGDPLKTGIAVTLASANAIEVDEARPVDENDLANATYAPALVYYHLATDVNTGRQGLYRQIRSQPGQPAPDELVAEDVSSFQLDYRGRTCPKATICGVASPPTCCASADDTKCCQEDKNRWLADQDLNGFLPAQYTAGAAVPRVLKDIRRVQVTLTATPPNATFLTAAAAAGDSSLTVNSTKGFRDSGTLVVFVTSGGEIRDERRVTYAGRDATHFTGCSGAPATDAGSVVTLPVPIGIVPKPYTVQASITPLNLAAAEEATKNVVPPAAPTGLAVIDTRDCDGKLRVKWNANTEPDLDGYALSFGPTGFVRVPLRSLLNKSNPEATLNPTDLLITKNADRTARPNTYTIQVAAYDSYGNFSEKSASVTANPSPDVTAFGAGNDTTVNPLKPSAPTGVTVAPGANEGELVVSWAAPADESATVGYRLYRSETPFTSGAHIADSLQIAGEADLGAGATTFTDRSRLSCTTYYYAVASVNCDETWVSGYVYNSDPTLSDYAAASGLWQEAHPPVAASIAGSKADVRRIFVTLRNPLEAECPDFARTTIYWSTAGSPIFDPATGTISDPPIPDNDNGTAGTFAKRGSQSIVFDDEDSVIPNGTPAGPGNPQLTGGTTYYLLPVTYDRCGNGTAGASESFLVEGGPLCTDVPPGAFSNPVVSSCPAGSITLSWSYPDAMVITDLMGFRVERSSDGGGTWTELTAGPTLNMSWTDPGPFQAGGTYQYRVTATDCDWEMHLLDPAYTLPAGYVSPPFHELTAVYPGGLQLDTGSYVSSVSDDFDPSNPATYTRHNNVRLVLRNTSASAVTVKRMSVSWDKADLVIAGVGAGTGYTTQSVGSFTSGTAFDVPVGVGAVIPALGTLPVLLRFTNADGTVNRLTDMRQEQLDLSLWVVNASFQDNPWCAWPIQVQVTVPRGPVLGNLSQSAPGRSGIESYEVPGPSGTARDTDVKVSHNIGVTVYGTAKDTSRELAGSSLGFASLKVYSIAAAAADAAAVPAMPTTGTLSENAASSTGGSSYSYSSLPQASGEVVWYFGLGVDATGNWDRVPDPDNGNYAYLQTTLDVCGAAPKAPLLTLLSQSTTEAVLTWDPPSGYTNGTSIPFDDVLSYDVYVKGSAGGAWTLLAGDLSSLGYTHVANLPSATYYYMVRAKNSCVTGAKVSADSNTVNETR